MEKQTCPEKKRTRLSWPLTLTKSRCSISWNKLVSNLDLSKKNELVAKSNELKLDQLGWKEATNSQLFDNEVQTRLDHCKEQLYRVKANC